MKFCLTLIRMHKNALVANAKLWEYDTESHRLFLSPLLIFFCYS